MGITAAATPKPASTPTPANPNGTNWFQSTNQVASMADPQNVNGLVKDDYTSMMTGNNVYRDAGGNIIRQMNRGSNNVYAADVNSALGQPNPTNMTASQAPYKVDGGATGGAGGAAGAASTAAGGDTSAINSYGGGGFGVQGVGSVNDASRRRVEEAIMSRVDPYYSNLRDTTRNRLVSQGLEVGAPGYESEMKRLDQGYSDAIMQSVLAGGQEESRQVGLNSGLQQQAYNQASNNAQFDNAIRQQMLQEMLLQRQLPLNEMNALRSGSQTNVQVPQGYYTNNTAASPLFDAAVAQGNYNAASQGSNAGMYGMIGQLGGAAISAFSDIRLKTNIQYVRDTDNGLGWYTWDWRDGSGSSEGVMAQEVQAVFPEAVHEDENGWLKVDYSQLGD